MSRQLMQQGSNRHYIITLLVVNFIVGGFLYSLYAQNRETFPPMYIVNLMINGGIAGAYGRINRLALPLNNRIEYRKSGSFFLLLLILPAILYFILNPYIRGDLYSNFLTYLFIAIAYISIIVFAFMGQKIIIKDHTITFTHGPLSRKSKSIAYDQIESIAVLAATDGIVVTAKNGSIREKFSFISDYENFLKILQQKIDASAEESKSADAIPGNPVTVQKLLDLRVLGLLTDDEFTAEIQKQYI